MHSCLKNSYLEIPCDTCDSKNTKTPVMCARELLIIGIFTNHFRVINFTFSDSSFPLRISNKKQRVVVIKTTRCFLQNDTLFSLK